MPSFNVGDVSITDEAFQSLQPGNYLYDLIIDYYSQRVSLLFQHSLVEYLSPSAVQIIHILEDADELRAALQLIPFDRLQYIVLPVNNSTSITSGVSGSHWSLLVWDRNAHSFLYYDSYRALNKSTAQRIARHIASIYHTDFSFHVATVSQQANGCDCGLYTIAFMQSVAEALSQGFKPPSQIFVEASEIFNLRSRLQQWIVADANDKQNC